MTEFILILLILLGLVQGATTAYNLHYNQDKEAEDIDEIKGALQMMGLANLDEQKELLFKTFKIMSAYTLLFSIPSLWFFWRYSARLGVIVSGVLLILDLLKIFLQYRSIKSADSIKKALVSKTGIRVLHFFRLLLKAVVIALLISEGF